MAFLTGELKLNLYSDSAQTEFPKELIPSIDKEFNSTSVTEAQVLFLTLAPSGTQVVNLNGVTAVTRLYIYSDSQDLNVDINSLGDIIFGAQVPGLMPFTVTSLEIENRSASVATNVTIVLIAD